MAGMTPPPGFYASSFTYLYSGSAGGDAALSWTLGPRGASLPSFGSLRLDAAVKAKANVGLDVASVMWVAPEKVLGGHFGVGVLAPVRVSGRGRGHQSHFQDTHISRREHVDSGRRLRVSDDTFAMGDPLLTAFIGWSSGHFHWKLTGLVNIPVGSYAKRDLVNIGFNRWAADVTGSLTWLDPASGFGSIRCARRHVQRRESGHELQDRHGIPRRSCGDEALHRSFAVGLAGYHYRQITGDSGAGAVLGAFKGEVSAIGPNLTYNFQLGTRRVFTSVRWLHEFKATNRMAGDAGFITVTVPIGGSKSH